MPTNSNFQYPAHAGSKNMFERIAEVIFIHGLRSLGNGMLSDLGLAPDDIDDVRRGVNVGGKHQTRGLVPWHI